MLPYSGKLILAFLSPEDVHARLTDQAYYIGNRVLFSYPIPMPPKVYEPGYRPTYYLIISGFEEILMAVDHIDESIDKDVSRLISVTVAIGLSGIIVSMTIIWLVSRMLTMPLAWMTSVAGQIVNPTKGASVLLKVDDEVSPSFRKKSICGPRTEINELVDEFQDMIRGFSGEGAAFVAQSGLHEIENILTYDEEFNNLRSLIENANDRS